VKTQLGMAIVGNIGLKKVHENCSLP